MSLVLVDVTAMLVLPRAGARDAASRTAEGSTRAADRGQAGVCCKRENSGPVRRGASG